MIDTIAAVRAVLDTIQQSELPELSHLPAKLRLLVTSEEKVVAQVHASDNGITLVVNRSLPEVDAHSIASQLLSAAGDTYDQRQLQLMGLLGRVINARANLKSTGTSCIPSDRMIMPGLSQNCAGKTLNTSRPMCPAYWVVTWSPPWRVRTNCIFC